MPHFVRLYMTFHLIDNPRSHWQLSDFSKSIRLIYRLVKLGLFSLAYFDMLECHIVNDYLVTAPTAKCLNVVRNGIQKKNWVKKSFRNSLATLSSDDRIF